MPQQPIGRAGQAALLKWVNTFALDRKVERLEDLEDGQVFAQMLHDLDPEYDPAELEQNTGSSAWLTNKRNIQSVFKALTKYIIHKDTSGAIEYLPRTVDVRAVSDNLQAEGLAQLVAVFVATAMLGEHNTRYIPVMRSSLTTGEQAAIMAILQQKDEERQRIGTASSTGSVSDEPADAGLVAEAKLATLAGDYDRLSRRLADTSTRLEHLQMSYEQLKEELERRERELDLERQNHGVSESQLVHGLQEKMREQDELISSQEAQAEDDRVARQRLTQENTQLSRRAALVEPLQDQVQELRHANEELSKKANTADRFRQKLEAQRGLEADLQNALYELGQHREAARELEATTRRAGQQQATIERFREMVSALEQQIEENRLQRAALEADVYAAHAQIESLRDQNQLSEARIAELEQQVLQGGVPVARSPGVPKEATGTAEEDVATAHNLEQELQQTADPSSAAATYTLEIARLRAENGLLRGRLDTGTEGDHRLRMELEAARAKEEAARRQYSEVLKRQAVAETQVQALLGGQAGEGSAVLADARQRLQETAAERDRQREGARALEQQVADGQREVLRLRGDLQAVDQGTLAGALAELQATDRLVSESLTQEVTSLRRDLRTLQLEKEQQQQLLVEALLGGRNKEGGREAEQEKEARKETEKETEREAEKEDDKDKTEGKISKHGTVEEQLRKTSEKNEKLRAAVRQLRKQYDAAEQDRLELQRRLRETASAAAGNSTSQAVRNLQRENALISSAWYDLTSRLQSNHVVLQRRQDLPRSWLAKQRQMVNATPRR